MHDQREKTEVNSLQGSKWSSSVMLEGEGVGSEIWMLKPVFQETEKFRAMAKPGCEDGSRGESGWRMRSRD